MTHCLPFNFPSPALGYADQATKKQGNLNGIADSERAVGFVIFTFWKVHADTLSLLPHYR